MSKTAWSALLPALLFTTYTIAQSSKSTNKGPQAQSLYSRSDYRPTAEKQFDLLHTKLDVRFDYNTSRMPGKAWLSLQPHFYATNTLVLDAKGMLIHKLTLLKGNKQLPLQFDYVDSMELHITLDKTYKKGEKFQVYIEYTARPDELETEGSDAITDAKGLYFINPLGKDSTKPIQIWTQGETESTSVWCPTIDRTNQKCTEEISMTVPAKYVTLSNGALVKQVKNVDGTRTDTWKMDLPHSPYLFFMGVGDFAVIKDKYKTLPVEYYVEKKYASVARGIFGETPAMIGFYSNLLGVAYPWNKYAQMVGQNFVSGAMENTTATLHSAAAYQNARQLLDENKWEIVVAHELFHQWFGDLVTAESWSNLTVNESFADYSEYLWLEHKYGKDHALLYNREAMQQYMDNPTNGQKHLARFQYADKEDMFDAVSYQKGGRILHMLRNFLGDSAFFKGLNNYLVQNKFKNAEADQLRLALEEVSGKDLNWFFDQWYFSSGHPKVDINYIYHDNDNKVQIVIEQTQAEKLFYLPVEVDIYTNGKASRLTYWIGKQKVDTISIAYHTKPDWINVDPQKAMLWGKTNSQSDEQWLAQARLAANAIDKVEAIEYIAKHWKNGNAAYEQAIGYLLNDAYFGTRKEALHFLKRGDITLSPALLAKVTQLASTEKDLLTKAAAIDVLATTGQKRFETLFLKGIHDSSYSVAGASLEALARINAPEAIASSQQLKADAKGRLTNALRITSYLEIDTANAMELLQEYKQTQMIEKLVETSGFLYFTNNVTNPEAFEKLVEAAADSYKLLRSDFQGLRTNIQSTFMWMIRQREAKLETYPNHELTKAQLKILRDKTGF
ncbi:MAG TPA: M1 family metallopeptidase [Phnomibacter sp.]|nr:M1 family metallopeptidase [Phnomibacter sp.]